MQLNNFVSRCRQAVSNITNALSGTELASDPRPLPARPVFVGVSLSHLDQTASSIEDEIAAAVTEIAEPIRARIREGLKCKTLNPDRGYFHVHRAVAHMLPRRFRWTVIGVEIINEILRNMDELRTYFEQWDHSIENHVQETKAKENERIKRQLAYHAETNEQREVLGEEIVRLLRARNAITKNYGRLYHHLRSLLPLGFRGSRGVGVIHAAMTDKLKWASHWQTYMEEDFKHSLVRDEELRIERRQRNLDMYRAQDQSVEALRERNESEDPFDLDDTE